MKIGMACGPVNGLTLARKWTGRVDETASPSRATHQWDADRGDCFRLFAVGEATIDDLEELLLRHPAPGDDGFAWTEVDPAWLSWTPAQSRAALQHPRAQVGFAHDQLALQRADMTVLVLPCGRSAHLELGYAAGLGQRTAVLMLEPCEAELMYLLVDRVCLSIDELQAFLQEQERHDYSDENR